VPLAASGEIVFVWRVASSSVSRPTRFEHFKYLGDKKACVVYDLDLYGTDPEVTEAVDRVLAAETFLAISPQTLAEARNRCFRPHHSIRDAATTE
jgi:hypothetical protein